MKLMKTIMSDPDMEETLRFVHSYIVCIKVKDVDRVDGDTDVIPVDENLTDTSHVSMFHRYIQTPLNPDYETLKEAIKVNHYQENQCWLNTITDYYKDTLMGEKRREKNSLTRKSMLTLICKSEEDFKTSGASIKEMVKVFEHYRIQVRIYNAFERLIFQYDPPKRDHQIPTLYAIVKNNHIYTVTDNLNVLRQTLPRSTGYDISVKASPDYHLNEKDEPIQCKMIQSLNDIKKFNGEGEYANAKGEAEYANAKGEAEYANVKGEAEYANAKGETEYTLIYDGHDLAELFYESKKAGYEPQVKFSASIVSELNFKFRMKKNIIKYKVKTQNLVNNTIDGTISVRTEQIYNNMSKAMYVFNKSLFNPLLKSYYNEIDMELRKECRAINPVGEINRHYFQYNSHTHKDDKTFFMPEHTVEIDIIKAFTHAFNKMKEIPVFTQFDVWKHYDYMKHDHRKLHELTLYLVKANKPTMFFNKTYNLVYGRFLAEYANQCEIIYYKQPSRVYNVDYRKITKELWQTDISDKYPEDVKIKQLIPNVNFGLLEKSTNTVSRSYAFDSLREALYYQQQVGGKINTVSSFYDEEVDNGNDDVGEYIEKESDKTYYCLTVSDRATLRNGYIYIKELLLQHHNHKMHEDYSALITNHIDAWSVKADAFTIRKEHLSLAKKVLQFNDHIGGWRHEKGKHIVEPRDEHKAKLNTLMPIPVFKNDTLSIADEWDTKQIAEDIVKHNPLMIRSKYAGGGKSHIAKYFGKLGYKTLFVVPQNNLSQNIPDGAVTTNKFFSIPVGDGDKLPEFDHSQYNVIVFDEIYMNGLRVLNCIRGFVNSNPDKIIIGAGDVKQLLPVCDDLTNTRNAGEYSDECIDQIFKYNILLKVCKRLGPKDDPKANKNRDILDSMYDDMWIHRIPLEEFVPKCFKTTDDVTKALHNIAYTNMRCLNMSNYIRKHLGKKDKYEVGDTLICRVYKNLGS